MFLESKVGVVQLWSNISRLNRVDSDSLHFVDDSLLIPLSTHLVEDHSVGVPLDDSCLPS